MTTRSWLGRACLIVASTLSACTADAREWADVNEEGAFLMYRRQSLIGEETFSITSDQDSIVVRSLQGENERGRITGVQAELHLGRDLSPAWYVNQRIAGEDTTNILEVAFELGGARPVEGGVPRPEPRVPVPEVPHGGGLPLPDPVVLAPGEPVPGADSEKGTMLRGAFDPTRDCVIIRCQDNGVGIAPDELDDIFEEYFWEVNNYNTRLIQMRFYPRPVS